MVYIHSQPQLPHAPLVADPAMHATAAGVDKEDVLEAKVAPQSCIQDLKRAGRGRGDAPHACSRWRAIRGQLQALCRAQLLLMHNLPRPAQPHPQLWQLSLPASQPRTLMAAAMSGQHLPQMWPSLPHVRTSS